MKVLEKNLEKIKKELVNAYETDMDLFLELSQKYEGAKTGLDFNTDTKELRIIFDWAIMKETGEIVKKDDYVYPNSNMILVDEKYIVKK